MAQGQGGRREGGELGGRALADSFCSEISRRSGRKTTFAFGSLAFTTPFRRDLETGNSSRPKRDARAHGGEAISTLLPIRKAKKSAALSSNER